MTFKVSTDYLQGYLDGFSPLFGYEISNVSSSFEVYKVLHDQSTIKQTLNTNFYKKVNKFSNYADNFKKISYWRKSVEKDLCNYYLNFYNDSVQDFDRIKYTKIKNLVAIESHNITKLIKNMIVKVERVYKYDIVRDGRVLSEISTDNYVFVSADNFGYIINMNFGD
jgi:hypothetical protein